MNSRLFVGRLHFLPCQGSSRSSQRPGPSARGLHDILLTAENHPLFVETHEQTQNRHYNFVHNSSGIDIT